jgi:hypothetical protein
MRNAAGVMPAAFVFDTRPKPAPTTHCRMSTAKKKPPELLQAAFDIPM